MPHRKSLLFFLITILSGLLFYSLTGQSGKTAAPSDQAREIQKAIDKTQSLLSESKKEKQQWFKKLELLQSQISYRRELQEELRLQLESINSEIDRLQKQNESQVAQLRLHQRKYAQSLKNKLINRLTFNPVLSLMQPASLDRQVKQWYIRDQLEARRMQTLRTMQDWKNQYEQSLEKLMGLPATRIGSTDGPSSVAPARGDAVANAAMSNAASSPMSHNRTILRCVRP
ncbi:MAG TPA: hypothetical protein VFX48_06715 [Saprospiraceae bacterium]|nr:hypothetical protein [Saprospiraceae bacterium]